MTEAEAVRCRLECRLCSGDESIFFSWIVFCSFASYLSFKFRIKSVIQDSPYIKKCNFKKFCSRACRKAVASAFSTANMKAQFPNIRTSCAQLVTVLKTLPRGEVVDMDSALCRESLDVIGDAPCPITFFTLGFIKGVGFFQGFGSHWS